MREFPLNESVNYQTVAEIAKTRFPEYKSFLSATGMYYNIRKNPFFKVTVKVWHRRKKNTTCLNVTVAPTFLGILLVGYIWSFCYIGFADRVEAVYAEEISRRMR